MAFEIYPVMIEQLSLFVSTILDVWWLVVPAFLAAVLPGVWLEYRRELFKSKISWVLLEIIPPREVMKTPKAMEQVFAAAHGMWSAGISPWKKWWKGVVEQWMSFELVGRAGSVHFYVRLPDKYKDMIESAIYAQYPEAEISEVPEEDDYVLSFPESLPNDEYDIAGTEYVLAREDGYPIRTYQEFEEVTEERRVDPIAAITEVMSRLERSEAVWLQIIIRAVGTDWTKKAKDIIDELLGKKKAEKKPFAWTMEKLRGLEEFFENLVKAPVTPPVWSEKKEEKKEEAKGQVTEGNKRIIEAVERKISKIGFEGALRFVYVDKKDAFTLSLIHI